MIANVGCVTSAPLVTNANTVTQLDRWTCTRQNTVTLAPGQPHHVNAIPDSFDVNGASTTTVLLVLL